MLGITGPRMLCLNVKITPCRSVTNVTLVAPRAESKMVQWLSIIDTVLQASLSQACLVRRWCWNGCVAFLFKSCPGKCGWLVWQVSEALMFLALSLKVTHCARLYLWSYIAHQHGKIKDNHSFSLMLVTKHSIAHYHRTVDYFPITDPPKGFHSSYTPN